MKTPTTLILFFLTFLYQPLAKAQNETMDSIVFYEDINFNSKFEKQAFENYFKKNIKDYFSLFLSIEPDMDTSTHKNYKSRYTSALKFDLEKLSKKKNDKKVKAIYNVVHDALFKKYELENHFDEVFSKGLYNCVSATALYSIIFNQVDIPYAIKEAPTHVYLIAYPNTDRVVVESTDPAGSFIIFDDRFKSTYIEHLKKSKIVSEKEFYEQGVNKLFDKYYFDEENIGLHELIGIQYANDGLYLLEKENYKHAFIQFEKAYLFYPSEKNGYFLLAAGAQHIAQSKYSHEEDVDYLAKISRYKGLGVTNEEVKSEFALLTNIYLIRQANTNTYEKLYKRLIGQLKDSTLQNEIALMYNQERGRVLYNQAKYKESLPFLLQAHKITPQNIDISNTLVANIAQIMRYQSDNKKRIDLLEGYSNENPILLDNNLFSSMLAESYLIQFGTSFDLGKAKEGLQYKELFQKQMQENQQLIIENTTIGRAYSMAVVYFFRKNQKSKAKEILKEGLTISPNNYELLQRQKYLR